MEFKYHFQAKKGWINDPNGLSFYAGKFHMFFQHNPYDIRWDTMHWGHAVSEDLLHWEELPIALYPEEQYENGLGCFSGSAIVHENQLHILYTGVDKKKHQWQCKAIMDSENHITKSLHNPVIRAPLGINGHEFRDPKITPYQDEYLIVCGTGRGEYGKVVWFTSKDLESFTYKGALLSTKKYGRILECPDFFPLGDKYVLVISVMVPNTSGTRFLVGSFINESFVVEEEYEIENSKHFYAPQSMQYNGKRIMIGWLRDTYQKGSQTNGCMSIPRELSLVKGRLRSYPISIYHPYLTKEDKDIRIENNKIYYRSQCFYEGNIDCVDCLRDGNLLEVFINHGEQNFIFCE